VSESQVVARLGRGRGLLVPFQEKNGACRTADDETRAGKVNYGLDMTDYCTGLLWAWRKRLSLNEFMG
jgi:hypothetical protein